MKKLYKSNTDVILAGVIGGIGEYMDYDPVVLRLVYVLIAVLTGVFPCVLAYIIAALIVPKKTGSNSESHTHTHENK